jgi:hypothetical protein
MIINPKWKSTDDNDSRLHRIVFAVIKVLDIQEFLWLQIIVRRYNGTRLESAIRGVVPTSLE